MPIHDERGKETRPLPIVPAEHSDEMDDTSILPASHQHDEHDIPTPDDTDTNDGQQTVEVQDEQPPVDEKEAAVSEDDDKTLKFSFESDNRKGLSLLPLSHTNEDTQDGHSEPKEQSNGQSDGHVPVVKVQDNGHDGQGNGHVPAATAATALATKQTSGRLPAVGATTGPLRHRWLAKNLSELSPEEMAVRRTRINHLLARKRRKSRLPKDLAPRLITAVIVVVLAALTLLSGSVGAAFAYYQTQLPLLDGIAQHSLFQTTHIYDRNGNLLYELYDHQQDRGRRSYVNYADISPVLVDATVAIEDRTFWSNVGVDFYGVGRALVANIQRQAVTEGGSTITQQLIKNQFFQGQTRTLDVKGQEAILATGLTQQYPKWKIMEMYLNTVYYGNLDYGVEAAAQDLFGLRPKCTHTRCTPATGQLTLAQASLLAGLPQSPSYISPVYNRSAALARQDLVLTSMVGQGMITEQQKLQAEKEMVQYKFVGHAGDKNIQAPHFVHYIIDEVLVPLLGAENLADGGYNIYTTIDLNLEKKVEQIVHDHLYKPQQDNYVGYYGPLNATNNVNNGAAVVINPSNGEILAMDGSADFNSNSSQMRGQHNAALALRQPGSSFKPVVYATAFEMGWYPAMIIPDHETVYPAKVKDGWYTPPNYDGKFHTGYPMTARTAIANSFNIPAIDALMYAGIPNVLNMAGRLGLSEIANLPGDKLGPSMALGAKEVSLLHLTGAYATFANQGIHVAPTSILAISDNQGRMIYHYDEAKPQGVRAVSPGVAFLMSSMLSDTKSRYHEFSPGNPLELDRPAAAKTGTTDSFRDNWTMGYTPHIAVGVWAGNSDNTEMQNVIGITGAGPIWHDIIEYASQLYHFPADDFIKPDNVHAGSVSAYTGLLPHPGDPVVTDWFIDGTLPTIQGSNYNTPGSCNGEKCKPPCIGENCKPKRCKPWDPTCPPLPVNNNDGTGGDQ